MLVIVGPTASGKSGLALWAAKKYNGELICADSRTVYTGMDIGTAKPGREDQMTIPHWGLDLCEPGQRFTVAAFKKYAVGIVADIQNRGKLPILVGGTGLYIDGVLYDFDFFGEDMDTAKRAELEELTTEQLQAKIKNSGYGMPENVRNRRHLVRMIEREGKMGSRNHDITQDVLLIGLMPSDEILKDHIADRAEFMFKRGIVEETRQLINKYGRKAVTNTAGIVYRVVMRLIDGEITQEQAKELFKTADWQYARRQKTWFRRDPHINWFSTPQEAQKFIENTLLNT
ncbi:tRNA (adenosine(37)-N6)-dimethylallyltransferase MiaA [Candidatus Saccharibacteria bacterium CG10_big_fil_rev_8_21_14_0_10_47_8]|nr:MAG: tRNA (adenosine(37)-N6)-dimethylallyltransferase MiaA [Candidatus Saccharibacteria bacterium CG10_big_fil_rev_8_21_14_0_10_47_8]